jgi:hypothetical protein
MRHIVKGFVMTCSGTEEGWICFHTWEQKRKYNWRPNTFTRLTLRPHPVTLSLRLTICPHLVILSFRLTLRPHLITFSFRLTFRPHLVTLSFRLTFRPHLVILFFRLIFRTHLVTLSNTKFFLRNLEHAVFQMKQKYLKYFNTKCDV